MELNGRQRLHAVALGNSTDRGILVPERYWTETEIRWRGEGMTDDFDAGYDYDFDKAYSCHGFDSGYIPPWPQEVISEDEDSITSYDENGILQKTYKNGTSMPQFISFPVKIRKDWEKIKPRLAMDSSRFPADWKTRAQKLNDSDTPVFFTSGHLTGFFGFFRELCGDKCYYMMHDDPEWANDIMNFQAERLCSMIRAITQDLKVDKLSIWEDMCYKNGPLISPKQFEQFILPNLSKVISCAKECGIDIYDVDSDGDIWKLMPLWEEAGVNMLHPFEVAAGMDVVEVKKKYPEMAVSGGFDKRAMAIGKEAIKKEFERLRPAMEIGRYMPAADHHIPYDVSFYNFLYYLELRREFVL